MATEQRLVNIASQYLTTGPLQLPTIAARLVSAMLEVLAISQQRIVGFIWV